MKERKKERKQNAPTETGHIPQSHAQDLFVIRVRGNLSLRSMNVSAFIDLLSRQEAVFMFVDFLLWRCFFKEKVSTDVVLEGGAQRIAAKTRGRRIKVRFLVTSSTPFLLDKEHWFFLAYVAEFDHGLTHGEAPAITGRVRVAFTNQVQSKSCHVARHGRLGLEFWPPACGPQSFDAQLLLHL